MGVVRTALVTGGARGIGREVAAALRDRGLRVVLGVRDPDVGGDVADELGAAAYLLDVADPASIDRCVSALAADGITVDVLVNNAAVLIDDGPLTVAEEDLGRTFSTNVFGPWLLLRALVPGMVERGYGRVVNVTSGAGSFGEDGPTLGTYGVSKVALNALTRSVAREVRSARDVKVNAVCPGWVRTDMGGEGAPRDLATGADGIVWAATLPPDGPSGGLFRDRRPIPW